MKFQYFTVPRVSGVSEYQVYHTSLSRCGSLFQLFQSIRCFTVLLNVVSYKCIFLRRRLKVWYRCAACCYHTFIKRIHLYYHAREKYTHVGVSQNNGESGQRGCFFCQQRTGDGATADTKSGRGAAPFGLYH